MVFSSPDIDRFHLAVGRALHAWQGAEEQLSHIFVTIIQPTVRDALKAAFYTQHGIPAKCQMISAALSVRLENADIQSLWRSLASEVKEQAKVRNQLAHGVLWINEGTPTLGPHLSNVKALENFSALNTTGHITADTIEVIRTEFGALHAKLAKFESRLGMEVMSFGRPINLPKQHL